MRTTVSLFVFVVLGLLLYKLWPAHLIDGLRNDPNVVLRAPWQPDFIDADPPPGEASRRRPGPPPLRVLFVGNSHTQLNGMPAMIAGLAAATRGARPFWSHVEGAEKGIRLIDHVSGVTQQLREQRFEYVVLQEQQQWPSFWPAQRQAEFEAPANTLDVLVRASGARTLLFMTWARRDGDLMNVPTDSYEPMQERVRVGYADASRTLGVPVVGVGLVWQQLRRSDPDLVLWNPDGSNPSRLGSYLAACVFYKAFYGWSPEGNPFHAGLPAEDAARLQRAAGRAKALWAPGEL
jgi:hypothetical protein